MLNERDPFDVHPAFAGFSAGDYVLRVTYYDRGDVMDNAALALDFARRKERERDGLPQNGTLVLLHSGTYGEADYRAKDAYTVALASEYLRKHGAIGENECRSLGQVRP
jgi:hypothetical protein